MELYSSRPPAIAPGRFMDMASALLFACDSSDEKMIPEKNMGHVSTPTVIIFPAADDPIPPARENRASDVFNQPVAGTVTPQ